MSEKKVLSIVPKIEKKKQGEEDMNEWSRKHCMKALRIAYLDLKKRAGEDVLHGICISQSEVREDDHCKYLSSYQMEGGDAAYDAARALFLTETHKLSIIDHFGITEGEANE